VGSGDNFNLLSDIVENEHRIGEQESKVREIEGVLLSGSQVLECAHHVVAQISNCAADKRGKAWNGHRAIAFHHLPETFERISTAGNALLARALHDKEIAPILVDDNRRSTAEKGVPCPFLTSLNGLKEVGGRAMIDFGKGRDWSLIVSEDLSIERNEITLSGILPKLVETK